MYDVLLDEVLVPVMLSGVVGFYFSSSSCLRPTQDSFTSTGLLLGVSLIFVVGVGWNVQLYPYDAVF